MLKVTFEPITYLALWFTYLSPILNVNMTVIRLSNGNVCAICEMR